MSNATDANPPDRDLEESLMLRGPHIVPGDDGEPRRVCGDLGAVAGESAIGEPFDGRRPLADAADLLRRKPHLRALLVFDGPECERFVNVVSAEQLGLQMARPFFRDLYERKPLLDALSRWPHAALELPADAPVSRAVEAVLARPRRERYEPLVVSLSGGRLALVDVGQLFLAQCRLQEGAVRRMREAEAVLRRAAGEDPLTGLPNRRGFNARLARAIERHAAESTWHYAVLCLDFDRFKWVNDSLGHDAGDELLTNVAKRLTAALRETDAVARPARQEALAARVGGDEFLVLLEGLNHPDEASAVAGRLLESLARPHKIAGQSVTSTASIGITGSGRDYAGRAADPEAVLREADLAMYRAKRDGGGRAKTFDATMHAEAEFRLTAEALLGGATTRRELRMAYQPIVNLADGRPRGYEALMRWSSPELGDVPPDRFIPLAEESGLVGALGQFALDSACTEAARWSAAGREWSVSVNVSRRQFSEPGLCEFVLSRLRRHELRPDLLRLEVTETSVMDDPGHAAEVLGRLRQAGVRIVLDDFGTGHSSLASLCQLPLDGVKLDRAFVRRLEEDPRQRSLVRAMIALAGEFGFGLVAEGIETERQAEILREAGCRWGQGFLYAKPMPPEAVLTPATPTRLAA